MGAGKAAAASAPLLSLPHSCMPDTPFSSPSQAHTYSVCHSYGGWRALDTRSQATGNLLYSLVFACPSVATTSCPSLPSRPCLRGHAVERKLLCTSKKTCCLLRDRTSSVSGVLPSGRQSPPLQKGWSEHCKGGKVLFHLLTYLLIYFIRSPLWLLSPYTSFGIS